MNVQSTTGLRRLQSVCTHLVSGAPTADACLCPLPHSGETHLVSPPTVPGWALYNEGDERARRFGTFRAEPLPQANGAEAGSSAESIIVPRLSTLPRAEDVREMAALLQSEGLVHIPGALSPAHVANLRGLFASLVPDENSTLDRWSGSAVHLAAVAAAELAGDDPPYIDRAIQTLFNREAGGKCAPFLQYLDIDPVCAVAEAVLGAQTHVIQHNLWSTPPGRPRGRTHVDYVPLSAPAEALQSGAIEAPVFVLTAHYYLTAVTEEIGDRATAYHIV